GRERPEPDQREEAAAEDARHDALAVGRRLVVRAEEHDDEEEEDDDRARVHDELGRREELRVERGEEPGDAQDEEEQTHRGANRVLGDDDGQRPRESERRARIGVDGHEAHRQLQGSTVNFASARLRSPRTYCSNSARNFWMNASAGMAVPSPNAQMVLPMMPFAMSCRLSSSAWLAWPSSSLVVIRRSHALPSRHGVHCPHDSWRWNCIRFWKHQSGSVPSAMTVTQQVPSIVPHS